MFTLLGAFVMAVALNSPPQAGGEIAVLTASSGLGTYVPAVQLSQFLAARSVSVSFSVLEQLYNDDKLSKLVAMRRRFQQDFRYALMAKGFLNLHSMADNLSETACAALLAQWQRSDIRHFIVFSGFWLPLLHRYRIASNRPITVDCVQMETVVSPSWLAHLGDYPFPLNMVWLYQLESTRLLRTLIPAPELTVNRERQLVVHGGGWNIGDYAVAVHELSGKSYRLLVARPGVTAPSGKEITDFWIAPEWESWRVQTPTFPPMCTHENPSSINNRTHWLQDRIGESMAIVSKPGGATLLDSLSTATPLVYLTPYGDTEKQNADLWQSLGIGISLEAWRATAYDEQILLDMRERLTAYRRKVVSYGDQFFAGDIQAYVA